MTIAELNQAETNISHLVGQQTHVIRAQQEEVHKTAWNQEEQIGKLKSAQPGYFQGK